MKTAEEIFMEVQDIECPNVNNLTLPEDWQLKAMHVYANQKLDEAAIIAQDHLSETGLSSFDLEKDIDSLKDKL